MFFTHLKQEIEELKKENEELKKENEELKKENEELKDRLNGDFVCDGYCRFCKNGYLKTDSLAIMYECLLKCKCKGFEKY